MRVLTTLLALILSGCASIPLSTIAHFSTFNVQSIAGIAPDQVRVRIAVPVGYEVDPAQSQLTISLTTKTGETVERAMELRGLGVTKSQRSAGVFSRDVSVNTYDLALAPHGVQNMLQLQQFALAEKLGAYRFQVNTKFASVPANARSIQIWADIKLALSDPYVKVIDGGEIEFEQKRG